jgi:hypothetical protein
MEFKLNTSKKINFNLVESHNYKILADIEGELAIFINNALFFYDEFILLLELGIQLTQWLESEEAGIEEVFLYETMDYNEGPIIEFIKVDDDKWKLSSVWQKTEVIETLSL